MEYIPHNWEAHHRWNADRGDLTHRLNYSLTSDSIVFDVGGYEGDWSKKIFEKYQPYIYIFEPVESFYNKIVNLFKNNDKVKIFKFGLGAKNESIEISLDGDGSSHISNKESKKENIKIKSLVEFLSENNLNNIDLIKINIEAAEFDLLDDVIKEEKAFVFKNIQVQFHTFIPDCEERRDKIRKALSRTHELTYDYTFIWENWKFK
jgi:FkbM family methyltransferase